MNVRAEQATGHPVWWAFLDHGASRCATLAQHAHRAQTWRRRVGGALLVGPSAAESASGNRAKKSRPRPRSAPILRRVKPSPFLALGLALTLIAATPRTAQAQESVTPAATVVPTVLPGSSVVSPIGARLALLGMQPEPARSALFAPTPAEVRLSHGAKTAIIVTAIVVGALVIIGVVALSRPGHL